MRRLDPSREASKFLRTVPSKHARQNAQKLESLRTDPLPPDSAPLHGADDYRRVTVGEYRLICRFTDETLEEVLKILHQFVGEEMRITVELLDNIEMVRTGKRLATVSKLGIDFQQLRSGRA